MANDEDQHLTREVLEQFLAGQILPEQLVRRVYDHLRSVCPTCSEEYQALWLARRLSGQTEFLLKRSIALFQMRSQQLEEVESVAQAELDTLLAMGSEQRRLEVARSRARYRNPFLTSKLLRASKQRIFDRPRQAQELAQLALDVALRVDPDVYGNTFCLELIAQASAQKGNCLRVGGELQAADEALSFAWSLVEKTAGDPLDRAEVLSLLSSLRRDQRRLDEAAELLDQAADLLRGVDDRQLAKVLLKAGIVAEAGGRPELALERLREARSQLDPERDRRLYVYARLNELFCLCEMGRHWQARAALSRCRTVIEGLGNRCVPPRLAWLEARIAYGLGEAERAEEHFLSARRAFEEDGLPYDAALVSLELALLYVEEGRHTEVRRLAEEMLPIFETRDIQREALATLVLFREAVWKETLSAERLRHLLAGLKAGGPRPSRPCDAG